MLMNECDAPKSNNTYVGWESMVNIPAIISSFCKISSASVKLTCLEQLTGTFFLIIVLLTRRELAEGWEDYTGWFCGHSRASWPSLPHLKQAPGLFPYP